MLLPIIETRVLIVFKIIMPRANVGAAFHVAVKHMSVHPWDDL